MSAQAVETLLARLYSDADYRRAFLEAPQQTAQAAGLDAAEAEVLTRIDRVGLDLAAESYARKRDGRKKKRAQTEPPPLRPATRRGAQVY